MKMKDSKTLLLDYLASIRDAERAASLFAADGVFELPFLRSLGVEPRYTGRLTQTRKPAPRYKAASTRAHAA
jgi:hypothetical protein